MTTPQAFALALQHHQAGRLAEAEALYRQVLAAQPKHADALHLLGVVAHQARRHDLAVEWIQQAIAVTPDNPAAHSNLGEAYRSLGRIDEATACYRRAIEINPQYGPAYYNLGNALRERRQLDEAIGAYRHALLLKPDHAEAHNNLGMALAEQGQFDEATAAFGRALQSKPGYAEAHINLGNALKDQGRFDEAAAAYGRAIELKPDFAEAYNNLGNVLKDQGRFDEAVAASGQAIKLKPDFAEAHNNLGHTLLNRGQFDEAIARFHRAIELKPDYALGYCNLGVALRYTGKFGDAVKAYRQALQLEPDSTDAHNNLGLALTEQGHLDEGVAEYRRGLELKPDFAEAHNNLGVALAKQGRLDEAVAAFRHVVQLKSEHAGLHSNLIYALHFQTAHDARTIGEEQERWNRKFSEPLKRFVQPQANDRNRDRPLRIGYVSPDFRDHVVGRNLWPLFRCHDDTQFEVLCYSGVVKQDRLTEEIRRRTAQWRNTVDVGDEALAEMIRQDGVDILVDLTQHMAGNRLPVFARQPAPVQVSFAGYPASTGLEAIGYRISDRYLEGGAKGISDFGFRISDVSERSATSNIEHQTSNLFAEQLVLIDSFWCYDPCGVEVAVNELPAETSGRVTFGCLNAFRKINESVLRLWARVLGKVTDSRLLLLSEIGSHRQRTLEILQQEGIEAHRVEFVEPRRQRAYLELHHRLDIVLDPFPYNGHTTSLDALWMGVPVVSLVGKCSVSRAGFSQLSNLGLEELAAFSEDDYVGIATQLAHDLPRLAELRATLRTRMEDSPLMDAPRFARSIETAYRTMWQQWCGASPSAYV